MIAQIRLQNFMSHTDTLVELAGGLTVLAGPNNCGKSAIVEALRAVCENVTASYMIRHGAKEARVTITTSDGHVITWIRTKTSAAYEIDGVRYDRLQGKAPDELHKVLRMPAVPVEGSSETDVHIAHQKEPIFLLNGPGSRPAAFFASSSDAGRLIQMQELHRKRKRERERDKRKLDEEIAELDSGLAALRSLHDVQETWSSADKLRGEIDARSQSMNQLEVIIDGLISAVSETEKCQHHLTPLAGLQAPPDISDTASLDRLIRLIRQVRAEMDHHGARGSCCAGLTEPPQLYDVPRLDGTIGQLSDAVYQAALCQRVSMALSRLSAFPAFADVSSMQRLLAEIKSAVIEVNRLALQTERLRGLTEPPHLSASSELARVIRHLAQVKCEEAISRRAADLLSRLHTVPELTNTEPLGKMIVLLEDARCGVSVERNKIVAIDAELQSVVQMSHEWVSRGALCPTCGALVTAESLLGGHTHE